MRSRSLAAWTSGKISRASAANAASSLCRLREVREHQPPGSRVGRDLCGLRCGQVRVGLGQLRLGREIGRLADDEVGAAGQVHRSRARAGVHHEGEHLPRPRLAHHVEAHPAAADVEPAVAMQPPDVRAGDAQGGQPVREQPAPVRLLQAPAVRLDPVVERPRVQREARPVGDHTVAGHRVFAHLQRAVMGRRPPQSVDELLGTRGEVQVDRMVDTVESQPLQHPGEPQAVVAVGVGDADAGDGDGGDASERELTLRPLTGVEQDRLGVPPQQRTVVRALARGHLRGGTEDYQLTGRHRHRLRGDRTTSAPPYRRRKRMLSAHAQWLRQRSPSWSQGR